MKESKIGIALTILAVVGCLISARSLTPPPVRAVSESIDLFSAHRAMRHLDRLAIDPRATGSEGNERARRYITEQIESMGLAVELQNGLSIDRNSWLDVANVTNVLTRIEGSDSQAGCLLIAAHYDTVPTSPGAADNGSAVASALEVVRILTLGPKPRNDLIFLFSDGEEPGLRGAHIFMSQHRWAKEIDFAINFEARGTNGPTLMFESSPKNSRLAALLAQSSAHPIAFSYAPEVYKRLGNDTDFSVFRSFGIEGLNFAYIGGADKYHTSRDDPSELDPRSLQHQGDLLLSLSRDLGNQDLSDLQSAADATFFTLPLLGLVVYTNSIGWIMALLAVSLLLGKLARGLLSHTIKLLKVLAASGLLLICVALCGVAADFLARALGRDFNLSHGWSTTSLYLIALTLAVFALAVLFYRLCEGKFGDELPLGGLLLIAVLVILIGRLAPGASYLFAIPLLLASITEFFRSSSRRQGNPPVGEILLLAATLIAVVLIWTPTLVLTREALGNNATPIIAGVVFLLLSCLLAPHLLLLVRGWRQGMPTVIATLPVVLLLVGIAYAGSGIDSDDPKANSVFYVRDADLDSQHWMTFDHQLDSWTEQFFEVRPESTPAPAFLGFTSQILAGSAPAVDLGHGVAEIFSVEPTATGRRIELRLRWPFRVHRALLYFDLGDRGVVEAVGGHPFDPADDDENPLFGQRMAFYGPPVEGIELALHLSGDQPLKLTLVAQRYALPNLADFSYSPRPAETRPRQSWVTDSTFIKNTILVEPATAPNAGRVDRVLLVGQPPL